MTIKLGINPITWSNDDVPDLGGHIPLETCLAETRMAGYLGTELGGKFPRESAALAKVLAEHDLSLVSGWCDGRILEREIDAEFEAITPHLRLLRDLGSEVVVYADTSRGRHDAIFGPISQRPKLDDGEWKAYGRKITRLAEKMAEFGVGMAFHHHMGTIVENEAEIDRLMKETGPAVGLLFDTGHCMFAGADPQAVLDRHARRVVHVHCKDVRRPILDDAIRNDKSFMGSVIEGIFTVPGDGAIDFEPLLRKLAHVGYRGWLVVEAEQDPEKAHPLTYARKGHEYLLRTARGVGFDVRQRPMAEVTSAGGAERK